MEINEIQVYTILALSLIPAILAIKLGKALYN